ncbi:MAG: hypothetical protein M1491_10100 [Deltaproteobacteria bacterium]|nr:hypothetical protein [Deltaproteobacteria bacterium]MCL5277619.1 hypothetical protein [Deltaproteobacteria bacterium]
MKAAGTTKKGSFSLRPFISSSYSFKDGSLAERCFSSSIIDSKLVKRSFSVILKSMLNIYLLELEMSRRKWWLLLVVLKKL